MKQKHALKSTAILLSIVSSMICNQSVAAQVPPADPSIAIDVPIGPPQIAITKDDIEKAAADELAAAKKEAEEKAAAIKKAAEQKLAELKASQISAAEQKVIELKDAKQSSAEQRAPGLKAAELKLAELKAADLQATELINAEIKLAEQKLAALKGEEPTEDATPEEEEKPQIVAEKVKLEEVSSLHVVKSGGSLSAVSANAYSRPGYWRILKLHNGVTPEKLQAGQKIKAPDLKWLLADSNFSVMYPEVSEDLLTARKLFMDVEDNLSSSIKNDSITPSEEDQKQLKLAIDLIEKCKKTLSEKKEGVKKSPSSAILQLRAITVKMVLISAGTKRAASTQNLVHEHLSNTIVYSVLWARDGFK